MYIKHSPEIHRLYEALDPSNELQFPLPIHLSYKYSILRVSRKWDILFSFPSFTPIIHTKTQTDAKTEVLQQN